MQNVLQLNVMQVSSPSSAANKMLCIGSACIGYCTYIIYVQEAAADV